MYETTENARRLCGKYGHVATANALIAVPTFHGGMSLDMCVNWTIMSFLSIFPKWGDHGGAVSAEVASYHAASPDFPV